MSTSSQPIAERKPAILFIDDEPKLLSSMKRLVHPWRETIDAEFVENGEKALELIKTKHFDVVISDMRMPGINGAELLKSIRRLDPETLRVVLSGQADLNSLLEALDATHRYISKPCELGTIQRIIKEAVLGKFWISSAILRKHISLLPSLPCQANVVKRFLAAVSTRATSEELSAIARDDLGLSLKLIHLVNALVADKIVTSVGAALECLSHEVIKSSFESGTVIQISNDDFQLNVVRNLSAKAKLTAHYAEQIARQYLPGFEEKIRDAGYLMNVGKLAILTCFGEDYCLDSSKRESLHLASISFEPRKVAAYLLSLWGIGDEIPRTIAGEEFPTDEIQPSRILVAAEFLASMCHDSPHFDHTLSVKALQELKPFLSGFLSFEGEYRQ